MHAAEHVHTESGQNASTSPGEQQAQLAVVLSISSASTTTSGVFRFWMDLSAAALRAALKAVIASVSCRPLVCSTRGARHTPLRTDIKSSIRIIEVYLVHWIPMIRFEQSASKEAEGNHIAFSYFILHTSYFILHTSYFILHKSYLPVTRQQKNKNKNTLRGAGESWRRDEGETSSAANQRDT